MKYKHNIDLDKLSDLPYREFTKHNKDRWSYKPNIYHNIGHYSPYDLIDRVCKMYLGQHINDAFSYYCKLVPKYQQKLFHKNFNNITSWGYETYLLDENSNIILNPKYAQKKIYKIYSNDYKIGYKYIGNNYKLKGYIDDAPPYYSQKDDYEQIVISGHIQYFESRKDPRWIKYHSEKRKKYKRDLRNKRKEDKLKQYNFLTKSELTLKLDKQANDVKIIKHGFDLVTSFRN